MYTVYFIFSAILCYLLSTMVHELGHVICGLLHHWKLFLLVVGPVKLYREDLNAPLKIGLEKNVMMWFGVGGTLPTQPSDQNTDVWAKILLAGPLTSIVFGVMMSVTLLFSQNLILVFLTLMPIAMGLACLIPSKMKTGLLYNDGTRYLRLRGEGQKRAEEVSLFRLVEIGVFGGDHPEFPEDLIAPLICSEDAALNYYGYYYRYINAKNQNDSEEMQVQIANMEEIRSKVPKIIVDDCVIK